MKTSPVVHIRRSGPLFAAGLLVFAGLASLLLQLFVFRSTVAEEDWEQAAAYVVETIEATDVVRVHPTWNEDGLPYLRAVGNLLHRHRRPLVEDLQNIDRIWIVSESARLSEALSALPFEAHIAETRPFKTVTVARVDLPSWTQFGPRLSDQLAGAEVSRRRGDRVEECRFWDGKSSQWHCAGRDRTFYVGSALLELEDEPRRCIWAHPVEGRIVRVEFGDVLLDEVLRIRAGLDIRATRFEGTGPVDYRIYLDEEVVETRTIAPHDERWYSHDIDTSSRHGESIRVALEVEAPNIRQRRFCFNGWPMSRDQAQRSTRMR